MVFKALMVMDSNDGDNIILLIMMIDSIVWKHLKSDYYDNYLLHKVIVSDCQF